MGSQSNGWLHSRTPHAFACGSQSLSLYTVYPPRTTHAASSPIDTSNSRSPTELHFSAKMQVGSKFRRFSSVNIRRKLRSYLVGTKSRRKHVLIVIARLREPEVIVHETVV
ncbi:hypothetical protein Bbelb_275190 [Branchiostoma belcheri]|nr:hypothetical protein Bbelb_275190 [Branchiostoma belcheri]